MDGVPRAGRATRPTGGERATRRASLSREPWLWVFVGVWSAVVSALHFGGLAYDVYTRVWWWDILTHSLSGFGVAGVLFLLFPRTFDRRRAPVVVGAVVLLVGAGFEVYEYLFKDFWYGWSAAYYAEDTVVDLVVDTVGALGFVGFVELVVSRTTTGRPDSDAAVPRLGDSPPTSDRRSPLRSDGSGATAGGHDGATPAPHDASTFRPSPRRAR